eukprot:CAMPEP_0182416428 /NCGR_PEP_ID=MMETSP1167-20130531/715_1 /TAXON_ID=2988 /ORGANISM="Mallomonas Sp, Strain CCMP3275" /LENGTH=123 /DNA_ID=CAMNT_0024589167 /DNA_START=305 /DNA_END=676 /DNA_ORIENTATION=+
MRSIESSEHQTTQWLIYWVVYGLFGCVDTFVDFFLYWIPFWYPLKACFLLWCMLPQWQGATFLYNSFIKDAFKKNEDQIDAALSKISSSGVADAAAAAVGSVASAAADAHKTATANAAGTDSS